MTKTVYIKEFSKYPGPRYSSLGSYSGEEFRDNILIPAIRDNGNVTVDLDGVFGYGSSFLEEAFGGLARKMLEKQHIEYIRDHLISKDDPSLIVEITSYINEALTKIK